MRISIDREWGPTLLRCAVGIVFLMHGRQKIFVQGFDGVAAGFTKMGIPAPGVSAVAVSLIEFLGGILLILGYRTRRAALLLAAVMAVATLHVHLANGFFLPRGFEFTFVLLFANLALALTGPGAAAITRPRVSSSTPAAPLGAPVEGTSRGGSA